ncbi:helix-turn-helix domain-containing protein [Embleya scabrispora]|uniref:AraC-like ligand-binding domain-containing protein n=1 Tax=Embleya scabrispora TaxID=159449 RepID=UPI000367E072|nr:helix-turn-helix domain-containing protein [Embleya scabrispora]MYS81635.1 helix-turn-helix domain-containing protein [Streptomyces sp. SID5474]
MIEETFTTDVLPRQDRWASWYDTGTRSHLPTLIHTNHQDDFRGSIRRLDLGSVQISTLTYSPLQVTRTPKLIRRSDPGIYYFVFPRLGRIGVAQAGRETVLTSTTLVYYDASRPFTAWATAEDGRVAGCLILQIPRKLFPVRAETLSPLLAAPLASRDGLGALLAGHLDRLVTNAAGYTPADAVRLAAITVDLSAALCAHELESNGTLPPETHRRAIQAQVHAFIREHLGDPDLSPDTIAAAHQISTRYLYKLFQDQGLAVADWIRRSRLERCRRDLADPALRSRPVLAIAAQWGFKDGANFSRVFRSAYGMPPGEYRNHHQSDAVREQTRTVRATTRTS